MKSVIADVLAKARSYDYVREISPHLNRGKEVDAWNKLVGNDQSAPWCAAFVYGIGHEVLKEHWPVIRSGGCQAIYDWAVHRKVIFDVPEAGDLMLVWHESLKRYAHVGFVAEVKLKEIDTIEGNTNPAGGREGYGVFERVHKMPNAGLKFVRWVNLMPESEHA